MIVPEKALPVVPSSGFHAQISGAKAADAQSVMSQEPPPYSEAGPSLLSSSPPRVVHQHSRGPSQNFEPHFEHPHQSHSLPLPPHGFSPAHLSPSPHRRPNSLPPSPQQHPWLTPPTEPESPLHSTLERHCNFLSEKKKNSSLKGIWNLDTSLFIPESLRPPMSDFHGFWNEMDKKSVRTRERERKKRESGGGWGRRKPVVDSLPPPKLANEGVMPNLMLVSKDGGVQAEVNVSSSDGAMNMATIVTESTDGSVKLLVNAPTGLPLRIFVTSRDGSARVQIPTTFEGAIYMTAEDGSANISEGIKSRLMTFSRTNKTVRGYIGDWQSTNFGHPSSTEGDPFKAWTGPLIHIISCDGSAHLAYVGEDTSSTFSKVMKSIYNGIVGDTDSSRRSPEQPSYIVHPSPPQPDPRASLYLGADESARPSRRVSGTPRPESSLFLESDQRRQGHKQ